MIDNKSEPQTPLLPSKIGTKGKNKEPDGSQRKFVIVDEICHPHSSAKGKSIILCLQKVEFEDDKQVELRLGYWIIGKKPGKLGKWVWGQYATFLPAADFKLLTEQAKARGWF
jgi:hypothetical protein